MLYYQTEIKPFDPNSADSVALLTKEYKILRAILEKAVLGRAWNLTLYLTAEGEKLEKFTMAPHVYNGHENNKGLLELMGTELPKGLEERTLDILRLQDLEGKTIRLIKSVDDLAIYIATHS